MTPTVLHLFCGLGGGALGFKRAGFRSVGAFDCDPAAVRDHDRLTGERGTVVDLGTLEPDELRAACTGRPDVVFTSPPCKSFSGCLPAATAETEAYVELSNLAMRGVWVALEAWADDPPGLFLLENVPRIRTRGRYWLDQVRGLLEAYGYAVRETTHDCGELGGLAQRRRRFLLVARHTSKVPEFVYVPPTQRVRGIGEVLGDLPCPVPGSAAGGPMHRLPRLSALNWVRLALIPAGGDWRDLPSEVALQARTARQNGGFGVEDWAGPSHAVIAEGSVRNTRASVSDPRLAGYSNGGERYRGKLGIEEWGEPSHTILATADMHTGRGAVVSDPRLKCGPRNTAYGVAGWDGHAGTVVAAACHDNGAFSVADPRSECVRREGALGVKGWDQASAPVIGHATPHNFPAQLADPRLTHEPHKGGHGVHGWASPSNTVIGDYRTCKGANVADPRVPVILGPELDLDDRRPLYVVIRAADGTWHRPMTTLELAALQGFPTELGDEPLVLDGGSHKGWRQRIGNAVPPPTAEAIATEMRATLEAAAVGLLHMSAAPVWVRPLVQPPALR